MSVRKASDLESKFGNAIDSLKLPRCFRKNSTGESRQKSYSTTFDNPIHEQNEKTTKSTKWYKTLFHVFSISKRLKQSKYIEKPISPVKPIPRKTSRIAWPENNC